MYIVRRTGDVSEEINGIVVSERMSSRERNLHNDACRISCCSCSGKYRRCLRDRFRHERRVRSCLRQQLRWKIACLFDLSECLVDCLDCLSSLSVWWGNRNGMEGVYLYTIHLAVEFLWKAVEPVQTETHGNEQWSYFQIDWGGILGAVCRDGRSEDNVDCWLFTKLRHFEFPRGRLIRSARAVDWREI